MSFENQTKIYDFFLVTPTQLEDLVQDELQAWLPGVPSTVVRGGVEFKASLAEGLELNRVLKTPTRVLLRLADFGCRDFPKLFRKISGFPWEEWIDPAAQVDFSVSTHTSRLRMKKRIEETCRDGYRAYWKKRSKTPAAAAQGDQIVSIYARFVDDVCTLSLDTSGEILHKRGARPLTADAPLRETLAASLLLLLEKEMLGVAEEKARAEQGIELVDPMMGGGTFLIEARDLRRPISSRDFAFEQPMLRPMRARERLPSSPTAQIPQSPQTQAVSPIEHGPQRASVYSAFVGYEADEKTWRAARSNLGEARAELFCRDFFTADPLPPGPRRWLINNPPYGERLKVQGSLSDFYSRLFAKCEEVARPEAALFLLPAKISGGRLRVPPAWHKVAERAFSNGGLPVIAHIFARR